MKNCTCVVYDGSAPDCPVHCVPDAPNTAGITFTPTDDRIEALTGMRSTPNTPIGATFGPNTQVSDIFSAEPPKGRIIEGGPVVLRPYAPKPTCICHLYDVGELDNCPVHAKKPTVQPVPLQMLLAAVTLIPDQPTTEQWQTIKNAILALVPEPKVNGS